MNRDAVGGKKRSGDFLGERSWRTDQEKTVDIFAGFSVTC